MDFLAQIATTTLKGTLSIPEDLPTATATHTHHPKHPTETALPPPPFEVPRKGHHGHDSYAEIQHIGKIGDATLWIVFALFTAGMIFAALAGRRVAANLRLFHHITVIILGTAMVSYLVMATGLGKTLVPILHHTASAHGEHALREVFYMRYIDWAITTPLLLLDLSLLAGLPYTTMAFLALADEAMILTGIVSALAQGQKRTFLFYGISCAFFVYVLLTLVISGRTAAKLQSSKVNKMYNTLMILTVMLWTAYPIVFALSEATGIISVNAETVVYGILDVIAKLVFGIILLISHSHMEGDSVLLPESWVQARNAAGTGYGALSQDE